MASKKKNKSKTCVTAACLLSVLLAVVLFVVMFLQAVVAKDSDGNVSKEYAGTVIAFGKSLGNLDWGTIAKGETKVNFSFGLTVAYLLPLVVAVALLVVCFVVKKGKGLKALLGVVLAASFIAAFILLLKAPALSSITTSGTSIIGSGTSTTKLADAGFVLGYGSIIGMVVAGLGAVSSLGYAFVKFTK